MDRIPLDREKESQVIGTSTQFSVSANVQVPVYNTPVTPYENFKMMLEGKVPFWMPTDQDEFSIIPRIIPDNRARALVYDAEPLLPEEKGGKDWFGIEWEFVPTVGGSMVKPGKPRLSDANDWPKLIKFPNLDDLDWEGSSKKIAPHVNRNKLIELWIMNGLFERLISFMDFEGAAMALLDEEQQDAVHALFDKLCLFYDDLIGRFQKYYGAQIIQFHDDWGSQRAPFFSYSTCEEMLLPYLKRVVDSCHKRGIYLNFHCCGKNEMLLPAMIEAGVDLWVPQPMNDTVMLAKKYGDRICLGAYPEQLPPDASDDVIKNAAKAFMDKYKGFYRLFVFGGMAARTNPAFAKLIRETYFISREEYNKL